MIGLQRSANNLSWIIGPMFATIIATFIGTQLAMAVFSGFLLLTALAAGVIVPKSLRMPKQAIKKTES